MLTAFKTRAEAECLIASLMATYADSNPELEWEVEYSGYNDEPYGVQEYEWIDA